MHVDVTWQPASSSMASADFVALIPRIGTGIDPQKSGLKATRTALFQAVLGEKLVARLVNANG